MSEYRSFGTLSPKKRKQMRRATTVASEQFGTGGRKKAKVKKKITLPRLKFLEDK